jgi:asparagine synthase (glutamine-hydrolysing)
MYNNTLGLMRATGGTHMSGEGGDEIFGVRRSTILRRLRDDPVYLRKRKHIVYAVLTLGPRATRVAAWRRSVKGQVSGALSYLRPDPRQQVIGDLARHLSAEPFEFTKSLGWHLRRRTIVAYQEGRVAFSLEHDVQHLDPFLEPRFVAAFARSVKPLGLPTRSAAMRALFSDLLPDEILTRTSKALFNRGFLTETGRAFARQWQGGGVDTDLVDPEALKTAWQAKWPQPQTFGLLQAAWLHENRATPP